MTKRHIRLLVLAVAVPLQLANALAGTPLKVLKKVGTFIDSAAVRSIDRTYIEVPERPWQLIVKGNVNQSELHMSAANTMGDIGYTVEPWLKTEPSTYAGLWAGYRGYGLGYTLNVGGDKGSYLTFGATGSSYGVNVRVHRFNNNEPNFKMTIDGYSEDLNDGGTLELRDPIRIHTVIADAYYLFNSKRFSHAAAFDQSTIQRRSAGSLMAGMMYYYGRVNYATDHNADLIELMRGLGKVKLWQGSIGVGYAYNWVPTKGLLVSALAMPMLTMVNKIKAYGYTTNIEELAGNPPTVDEDDPDADEKFMQWWYSSLRIGNGGTRTANSGLTVNIDARLSLTYNFGNCFINAYGQFYNFHYSHEENHGHMNDWYINAAFGIRI